MGPYQQFDYETFIRLLKEFVEKVSSQFRFDRANRLLILEAENSIKTYLTSPVVITQIGCDVYFHFRIWLQVNPLEKRIKINLNPLTPVGLDCCLATGIPVEESLQKQIRKAYNESLRDIMTKPDDSSSRSEDQPKQANETSESKQSS